MSKHNRERRKERAAVVQVKKEAEPVVVAEIRLSDRYPLLQLMGDWAEGRGPKRDCGGCTKCCTHMGVSDLNKPPNAQCEYERPGEGCGCYGSHPLECKVYACLWKMGWGDEEKDRPDRSGVLLNLGIHPSVKGRDTLDVIELQRGAIVERFSSLGEIFDLVPPELVTVTIIAHGVPRARTLDSPERYHTEGNRDGQNSMVGGKRVLVQLGVRLPNGGLAKRDRTILPEHHDESIKRSLTILNSGIVETLL